MKFSTPSFAIVTLAKNDEVGLRRTRNSVRIQTGANFQHHLVVGESTDNTEEIAMQIGDEAGVTVWTGAPHGIYPAMNWILERLNFEDFVWFLNSSDFFLHEHVLEDMATTLARGEFVWGTSGFMVARPSGQVSSVNLAPMPWKSKDVAHQATCVKVHVLRDAGGFDTDFKIFADGKAMRIVMKEFTPGVLEQVTTAYMEGGFSGKHPLIATRELRRLDREYPLGGGSRDGRIQAHQLARAAAASVLGKIDDRLGTQLLLNFRRNLSETDLKVMRDQPHWKHVPLPIKDLSCCLENL